MLRKLHVSLLTLSELETRYRFSNCMPLYEKILVMDPGSTIEGTFVPTVTYVLSEMYQLCLEQVLNFLGTLWGTSNQFEEDRDA